MIEPEGVTTRETTDVTTTRRTSLLDSPGGHIIVGFCLLIFAVGIFLAVDAFGPAEDIKGGLLMLAGNIAVIVISVFKRALEKAGDGQ